jgi:hypothetical protein
MRTLVFAAIFVGLAAPALADESAPATPVGTTTAAQPAPAAPAPKICKKFEKTGELVPRTICHTQAEWDADATSNELQARGMLGSMAVGTQGRQVPGIGN